MTSRINIQHKTACYKYQICSIITRICILQNNSVTREKLWRYYEPVTRSCGAAKWFIWTHPQYFSIVPWIGPSEHRNHTTYNNRFTRLNNYFSTITRHWYIIWISQLQYFLQITNKITVLLFLDREPALKQIIIIRRYNVAHYLHVYTANSRLGNFSSRTKTSDELALVKPHSSIS